MTLAFAFQSINLSIQLVFISKHIEGSRKIQKLIITLKVGTANYYFFRILSFCREDRKRLHI